MKTDSNTTLLEQLSQATALTPNRRLSATLHKLYRNYQQNQDNKCWQTPDILPIASWLQRLWNDERLLLNTAQEQYLWEQLIAESAPSHDLLQITETAELARSAYSLLKQWQIDVKQPIFASTEDSKALQQWTLAFERKNQAQQCIDNASLIDAMIEKIKNNIIQPPKQIILIGFNEISPQLKQLLTCCTAAGSKITQAKLTYHQPTATIKRISLIDTEQEIVTMARWAKSIYQQHAKASIGCVIPNLDKIRNRVVQIFTDVFTPAQPFNISAGKSLLHYPITHTAIQLLNLQNHKIPISQFNYLLTSPFIGEAESERNKRSYLDSELRRKNLSYITLTDPLIAQHCPRLAKRIQTFLAQQTDTNKQTFHAWAVEFNTLLSALGWPGERSLNSEEYQIVDNFLKTLQTFASLDQVAAPCDYNRAWQHLQKLAGSSLFQPQTPEAPIQILGLLEAAGLPFDYLWVAGMDDMSWPPAPKPNPLIPKRLQRELQMPHATSARELHFCNDLMKQFKENSHVIFSHTQQQKELSLEPSALIRDLPEISLTDLALPPYLSPIETLYQTKMLETLYDEIGPAIYPDETLKGGIDIIKQQSLCPFLAFAKYRLHAKEIEELKPGLRPKERGTVMHKVLEDIWRILQDHKTLAALDSDSLQQLIKQTIQQAFTSYFSSETVSSQYLQLEQQRLQHIVWDWLQLEKERPPFKVSMQEKTMSMSLANLTLTVRVDRIDELANGKKLIIDYKTGKNNPITAWFGNRPEDPQLPLYALLDTEHTAGITYAQLYPGELRFKGISCDNLAIQGIDADHTWQDLLVGWQKVFNQLSSDFSQGVATVDPKNPSTTCQWCSLKPLCRIYEEGLAHVS